MVDIAIAGANGLQLAGLLEPTKLVANILEFVKTVKRNKKECEELGKRVKRLDAMLPSSEATRRAEVREFLEELKATLQQAFVLVQSCQKRKGFVRFFTAWREARQIREVREKIDELVKDFPVSSYADLADKMNWLKWALIAIIGLLLAAAAVCTAFVFFP